MKGRPKTSAAPSAKAKVYWEKAQRYARAARANAAAGENDPAVSNAVHAVINVADALCIQYLGKRSASGAHGDALRLLGTATDLDAGVREQVGKRLGALLSVKHLAEYEDELVGDADVAEALKDMERAIAAALPVARKHGWT